MVLAPYFSLTKRGFPDEWSAGVPSFFKAWPSAANIEVIETPRVTKTPTSITPHWAKALNA